MERSRKPRLLGPAACADMVVVDWHGIRESTLENHISGGCLWLCERIQQLLQLPIMLLVSHDNQSRGLDAVVINKDNL